LAKHSFLGARGGRVSFTIGRPAPDRRVIPSAVTGFA